MILRYYFRIIQQAWWLIAVITLLAWTISLGVSFSTIPHYRAKASLIVYPNASLTSSRDVVTSLDTLDKRSITSTYENILNSERVYDEAIKILSLNKRDLKYYKHYTEVQSGSNTINLIVEGPDPRIGSKLANAIGENSIRYIKGIYQVFDITFLDQAVTSTTRFRPQALRDGGIALGIGFLAGILIAILVDQLRVPLESLRKRSITDRLSSAYTQAHFKHLLEEEIAQSPSEPVAMALMEFEGLRELVDGLPEPVLRDLLHKVTDILRRQLRGNDIVGRWSRSSFSLLLPGTPGAAATRTMERIRQALTEPIAIEATNESVSLEPCIGITERLKEDEPSKLLIERAENALEQARQSEKKTVFFVGEIE
ncbi:MAG: diguanylate cyclase [Chloroflexota bacterium]